MDPFFLKESHRRRSPGVVPCAVVCALLLLCLVVYRGASICSYAPQPELKQPPKPSEAPASEYCSSSTRAASVCSQSKQFADGFNGLVQPLLSRRDVQRGVVYSGNRERLRAALLKYLRGDNFTLAVVGGSITAGAGAQKGGRSWPNWLFHWLGTLRPSHATHFVNGAVPGTLSAYMAMCVKVHVPEQVDVVILEYAVNDPPRPEPYFQNTHRRGLEQLIRKLLQLPQKPAVVLLNSYTWFHENLWKGSYVDNAEAEFFELATYYGLSMLSVKAAAYKHMVAGKRGFQVDQWRWNDGMALPKGSHFFYDHIHPDGHTGHKVMAELVMELFRESIETLALRRYSGTDEQERAEPLLPPLIPDNWESRTQACLVGFQFKEEAVTQAQGFEWLNEAPDKPRPKWGYVATQVGSYLDIMVSTAQAQPGPHSTILFAYLRSYQQMGQASVSCISGCSCNDTTLEGHHEEKNSQTHMMEFPVTQAEKCTVRVTVTNKTISGGHKVKLIGVVITDGRLPLDTATFGGLDYVHDMVTRGNGTYDARNHV